MRIVAGAFRGRRLAAPAGLTTRPTPDRVRESLFQILGDLNDARVLDAFAGTGALGLEALSRGAAHVTFIERDPETLVSLRANIDALGVSEQASVIARDTDRALAASAQLGATYDLVFLDPPFSETAARAPRLGSALTPLMTTGGRVVLEYDASARDVPEFGAMPILDRTDRRYGSVAVAVVWIGTAA